MHKKNHKSCHRNEQDTLLILPYSPISNQILQSFRFVLNQSLCAKRNLLTYLLKEREKEKEQREENGLISAWQI